MFWLRIAYDSTKAYKIIISVYWVLNFFPRFQICEWLKLAWFVIGYFYHILNYAKRIYISWSVGFCDVLNKIMYSSFPGTY